MLAADTGAHRNDAGNHSRRCRLSRLKVNFRPAPAPS